jgi:cystathionine beta-synthase
MRKEGLLVGGSSGSSLSGALQWLHSEAGQHVANTEGLNVIVLLPDGYVVPVDTPPILGY